MGQPTLSTIQVFQKMLETQTKHELLMKIHKESWEDNMDETESLRGQCGSDCIIFCRLMKILWKDNMDRTVLSFMTFLLYPGFRKPG